LNADDVNADDVNTYDVNTDDVNADDKAKELVMDLRRISRGVALGCGSAAIVVAAMAASGLGPASAADEAPTDLTIVVNDGTGTTTTWHLTCSPEGGDHPDPAEACTVLDGHAQAVLLTPAEPICTQPDPNDQPTALVYGGPQTAQVTGTWQGQPVDTRLDRADGCQTARWDALVGLLPAV
jgi:hypothetical protein